MPDTPPSQPQKRISAEDLKKKIGLRIRALRQRQHPRMRQEDLGSAAGVSSINLSKLERGKQMPDLATVWRLAEALNVSPSAIIDVDVPLTPAPGRAASPLQPELIAEIRRVVSEELRRVVADVAKKLA